MHTAHRVTVGDSPIAIHSVPDDAPSSRTIWIRNAEGGPLFLGDELVTAATGFMVPANTIFGPITIGPGFELWGVRALGSSGQVHMLSALFMHFEGGGRD